MITLPELLAVLHNSDQSFATLHARYRVWEERTVGHTAFASAYKTPVTHESSRGEQPEANEATSFLEVWHSPPELRIEEAVAAGKNVTLGDFIAICRPWRLSAALRLDVANEADYNDRRVVQVTATPRLAGTVRQRLSDASHDLLGLGPGATNYELEIDAELGIVVKVCALFEGQRFHEIALQSLELNEPLPPDVFAPGQH